MNASLVLLMMVFSSATANELQVYKDGYSQLVEPWARPMIYVNLSSEAVKAQMAEGLASLMKIGIKLHNVKSGVLSADKLAVKDFEAYSPVLTSESTEFVKTLTFEQILLKAKEAIVDGENKLKKILREKPAKDTSTLNQNWLNKETEVALDSPADFKYGILGGIDYIVTLILNKENYPKQYTILKHRYFEYLSAYVDSFINRINLSTQLFIEEDNQFEAERWAAREQRDRDEEEQKVLEEAEALFAKERLAEENARKEKARLEKERLAQEAAAREAAAKQLQQKKNTPAATRSKTVLKKSATVTIPSLVKKPTAVQQQQQPLKKATSLTGNKPAQKQVTKENTVLIKQDTMTSSAVNSKVAQIRKAYYDAKEAILNKHKKELKLIKEDIDDIKSGLNGRAITFSKKTPIDEKGKQIVAGLIEMVQNLDTENIFNIRSELEVLRKEVAVLEGTDVAEVNVDENKKVNILI